MKKKIIAGLAVAVLVLTSTACGQKEEKQAAVPSPSPAAVAEKKSEVSASPAIEAKPRFIFTADEGGSMTRIDPVQNIVMETIKADGSVHNVQLSPDGKILGATLVPKAEGHGGHGAGHGSANGYALFYDTSNSQLIKKVEVGSHPAHIVFTSDQKLALVTNNENNTVTVIDTQTYKPTGTIPTGKGPHGFRISADGRTAYVANMGEETVSVLDLATMKETRKIKVGQTPVTTAVTSDGKWMVVTLNAENAAVIVDLATDKVEKVAVGAGPAQVYIQSDNKAALVANQGTEKSPSNTITKIDLESKKAIATIETGKGAHGLAASSDNKWIYVTNMFDHTVSVVDNVQNKEVAEIKVGQTPNGITLFP
jgi:YVTN family beta-propeller protein